MNRLLAKASVAAATLALVSASAHAQTIHELYATDILDSPEWVREVQATGPPAGIRCENAPLEWAANNTLNPAQLHAYLFDVFTPPAGEEVTGLWVDVLARKGTTRWGACA